MRAARAYWKITGETARYSDVLAVVSAAPVGEAATAILPEIRQLPGQCIQVLTDLAYDPQRLAWDGSQDEAMHGDNVIRDNARAMLRLRER